MKKNNQSYVIFADLLLNDVKYLCRRADGRFYTCIVAEENGGFCEYDVQDVSAADARKFVAAAFNRAMNTIR